MYTKCLYTKCIPHIDKLLYTFQTQNLAAIILLTLYTKRRQKFVEMWNTFCIHLVQFLYPKCIHSFCAGDYYDIVGFNKT